jgi:hypothetical protein
MLEIAVYQKLQVQADLLVLLVQTVLTVNLDYQDLREQVVLQEHLEVLVLMVHLG